MSLANHLGLRGRLILLLLLAAFAVIFAMIVLHSVGHRANEITHTTAHLLNNAKLIAAQQRHIAARADAILNSLMTQPELRPDIDAKLCEKHLSVRLKQEAEFIQIGRALPDGELACAAVPATGRVSYADRSWFQTTLQSRGLVISEVITGRIVGKPIVVFAKAMRDDSGHVTGLLFLSLDLTWLHNELANAGLPEGARLTVVDGKGTVVIRHPDRKGLTGINMANTAQFRTAISKVEGVAEETGLDGVPRLFAFTPLLDTVAGRMQLWLSVPKTVVTAPAQHEIVTYLAITTMVLILVLTLVYWVSEKLLVRPLMTLFQAAARFSAGDRTARTGLPYSDDEVGRLAQAMDEVAETVQSNEGKLARANHALRVLSAGNRALLRAKSEQGLLDEMCRTIVDVGGYRMAWVGYAEHDRDKSVRPVASWNTAEDFFDGLRITWDEMESGRGPTGTAICRGIPVTSNNVLTDPDYAPWQERAQRYGYAASLALPIRTEGAVIGALNIYAAEPDAFDQEVVELLSETADDLASGIATLRAKAEHELTQAELKRQEERNTLILKSSGEGIFGLDSEEHCTFINSAGTAMLQWTAEELAGQTIHAVIHHTRADGTPYPREECPTYAAYKDGTTHRMADELFWRKDGTSFPVEYVSTPINDERGKPVGAVVTFNDITERKRAEEALQDSAEKFRAMGASAQDALIMIDNDGHISFWNAAAETIFGYSGEEALGRNLHELLTPERFHEAQRMGFEHFRQSGTGAAIGKPLELAALRKGGAEFPVELSLNAVKIGGQWCAVGIIRDITQRKQAEENLRRERDKLQETEQMMIQSEKMAAVGTLAAGVAHEINNPASYVYSNVVTLRGYVQRLMKLLDAYEKTGAFLPAEMRQAAEELENVRQQVNIERVKADLPSIIAETLEGIERIIRIVGDLKSFSHLDAEEIWKPADLNQALDATLNVVWNEIKYKMKIRKEYGELPPVTCLVFQLNQVFMNLLVNAGQAIDEHGTITLRTGVAGEEVWVEVSDTGRGIPEKNLKRIFEPFFTTKPEGKGTGLGLWIAHGIVEKHKGRIEVSSKEGVGTTFRVWLPNHPVDEN